MDGTAAGGLRPAESTPSVHLLAVQHDIVWEDKPANHRRVDALVAAADPPPGALVVLPELGDSGFSFNLDRICDDATLPWASRLARRHGVWVQAGFARRADDGFGRNVAVLVAPDGRETARYEKLHPFSFGRESAFFRGGERPVVADAGGVLVGPTICYDLRFPELFRHLARAGAEVLSLGANWPDARRHHWRALAIARAIENQAVVIAVNRVGKDPSLAYAGDSIIVAHDGTVLAEAGADEAVLSVEIDLAALREWRARFPALADVREELLGPDRTVRTGPGDDSTA